MKSKNGNADIMMNELNSTVCYDEPELVESLTMDDRKLETPLTERTRLQKEERNAILQDMEDAKRRLRIQQIKNRLTESSTAKKQGSILNVISLLFGRSDRQKQQPAKPETDAYSVVAVCDKNETSDECNMQLEFMPLSKGTPKLLAQKYLSSPALSESSCDSTVASSQAEF